MEHFSGAPLWGMLLTSPTNIRLDCKGIPGTNTLALLTHLLIATVKSFITFSTGVDFAKLFSNSLTLNGICTWQVLGRV